MKSLVIFAALCVLLGAQAQDFAECVQAGIAWSATAPLPSSDCLLALNNIVVDPENATVDDLATACAADCYGSLCDYNIVQEQYDCAVGTGALCAVNAGVTLSQCDACDILADDYPYFDDLSEQCIADLTAIEDIDISSITDDEMAAFQSGCNADCFDPFCGFYAEQEATICAGGLKDLCLNLTGVDLACDDPVPPSSATVPGAIPAFLGLVALLGTFFRA